MKVDHGTTLLLFFGHLLMCSTVANIFRVRKIFVLLDWLTVLVAVVGAYYYVMSFNVVDG